MTGILLAGGRGKRLGQDKASIPIGGEPLIRRVARTLQTLTDNVIIVGGDLSNRQHLLEGLESPVPISFVPDLFPGKGSLGGIYSGLTRASSFLSITVACDMPFINLDLIGYMIAEADDFDVVVPRVGPHLEPLHAVYSKNCLGLMEDLLKQDNLRIVDFFPHANVRYVDDSEIVRFDPEYLSIFNINTPEDLEKAERLVQLEQHAS